MLEVRCDGIFRCVEGSHPSTRWARSTKKLKEGKEKEEKGDGGGGGGGTDKQDELLWLESDSGQHSDILLEQEHRSDQTNLTDTLSKRHVSRRGGLKGRRR